MYFRKKKEKKTISCFIQHLFMTFMFRFYMLFYFYLGELEESVYLENKFELNYVQLIVLSVIDIFI